MQGQIKILYKDFKKLFGLVLTGKRASNKSSASQRRAALILALATSSPDEQWAGCDGCQSFTSPRREGVAGWFCEILLFLAWDLFAKEKGGAIAKLLMWEHCRLHDGEANQN